MILGFFITFTDLHHDMRVPFLKIALVIIFIKILDSKRFLVHYNFVKFFEDLPVCLIIALQER